MVKQVKSHLKNNLVKIFLILRKMIKILTFCLATLCHMFKKVIQKAQNLFCLKK